MSCLIEFVKNIRTYALFFLVVSCFGATVKAQVVGGVDLTIQPDGKILVYGNTSIINSTSQNPIVRFNQEGRPDPSFNYTDPNFAIRSAVVQPDGKIVVAGSLFDSSGGLGGGLVRRLNSDGTIDSTFSEFFVATTPSPASTLPTVWAIQPDGKIIISVVTSAFGIQQYEVRRLNSNGGADNSFTTIVVSFGGLQTVSYISKVVLQADGKIIVGSRPALNSGGARGNVKRYNQDGTVDSTFTAPTIEGSSGGNVNDVVVGSDGGIIFGGIFQMVNSVNRNSLAKLLPSGILDTTFTSPLSSSDEVTRIAFTSNNQIIVSTSNKFIKLNANGTVDASFNSPSAITQIAAFRIDSANRIVFIGSVTENGATVYRLRRLNADGTLDSTFAVRRPPFDFDGDGKADVAVFRPSNGFWYRLNSQNNSFAAVQFGQSTDKLAPADFDGDGKTDIAVFREAAFAYFYILNSSDNTFRFAQFGTTGDAPLPGDWDGDGKADPAVYRAAATTGGQSNFYYRPSSQPAIDYNTIPLGTQGDKAVLGDFDGDGRIDPAVFRSSTAAWIILRSSTNQIAQTVFGTSTDIPAPADYDGNGTSDIAVFRPSNGTWYTSQNPQTNYGAIQFGAAGDLPVPADYDGDGRADVAVFRNGAWYVQRSTAGLTGVAFGQSGDKPVPNSFIP